MILKFFQNKDIAKSLLINLAIYSTVLDVMIFLTTIISTFLKLSVEKILLPINIAITITISIIIVLWFYIKLADFSLFIKSFVKRNFEISVSKIRIFDNGKYLQKLQFKFRFFSLRFRLKI